MSVLRLHGVSAAWVASVPLLDSVSLTLTRGFYGLVGANGAGKTTFLSLLTGELSPSEGSVQWMPCSIRIAHCPQLVEHCDEEVLAFAERTDGVAWELRGRLALEQTELQRWETLSPGERKRWQIAAALAQEPDVLLLDEPTNHLDSEAKRRLLSALRRFKGLGIIVSHDRAVLDDLTTATLRIHQRTLVLWPGQFSEAKLLWEQARVAAETAHSHARERIRAVEAQLDQARRMQEAASQNVRTSRRMKNKKDSDARGLPASTQASWAASRAGRVVASAQTQLQRERSALPSVERDKTQGARIFAHYQRAPHPILFHLNEEKLVRGEYVVLRDVRVSIRREERVRIEGPNGAGKTSLLEAFVGSMNHPERILYLPQEIGVQQKYQALQRMRSLNSEERGRLLSIFAALGSEPERVLQARAEHLSPGEARKLLLAEALARQVWALVLDEPTNHMDLPSVERLETALKEYPGALVLVTHDERFAAELTTRSLYLEQGMVLEGGG